jgi:FkbM family methyltransferase
MKRLLSRALSKSGHALVRASRVLWRPDAERRHDAWRTPGHRTRQFEYPLGEGSLVLDLGGYEGQWTSEIVARYGCTAHVFEPVPAFAQAIAARFHANPRVHVHAFGLGAAAGTMRLALAADGTSALRDSGAAVEGRVEEAAAWLAAAGIGTIDLAKINIEGGEYDLLEHLIERGVMPRIRNLQIQFHDFVPGARERMQAIHERLAATHAPEWRYEFVWESWALKPDRT